MFWMVCGRCREGFGKGQNLRGDGKEMWMKKLEERRVDDDQTSRMVTFSNDGGANGKMLSN